MKLSTNDKMTAQNTWQDQITDMKQEQETKRDISWNGGSHLGMRL